MRLPVPTTDGVKVKTATFEVGLKVKEEVLKPTFAPERVTVTGELGVLVAVRTAGLEGMPTVATLS